MSASDGYILGTTKIVDHGPDNTRWNLVIVGDGYRANEITQYHTDVQTFLTTFRTATPFDELFAGINVYRIDVVSNQSGADDPGCAGGAATTANTYFDATFCTVFAGQPMDRLLSVDDTLALSVVNARVPNRHQVLCIVNSNKFGGSGGLVTTSSSHAGFARTLLHELGHSAFYLADEYGGNGSGTPVGEPPKPNVTRNTNRATNKWRALIAATTPMPTQCDATCAASTCNPPANPPPPNVVGTYEGAIYSDCNTYRPFPNCRMRNTGADFCPVCAGVIRQTLQTYVPAESINLVSNSINFLNVPAGMGGVGVTTHRAIVWEVVTHRTLQFEFVAPGPTGGFGTPQGNSVSVTTDPILPMTHARLWLSYTSTNAGDTANGTATVRCVQTGQTWNINITANTVARPTVAVALVLDRSGSMGDDAGDAVTKVQKLREAADTFISLMRPGDGLGLVRFNQAAQRLMEIRDVGAAPGGAGRTAALGHINGNDLNPGGSTSIGDGVVKGKQMLDAAQAAATPPSYNTTAMVLLTDGMWNQPPSLASISGSITANTFAVGLGLPSNISVPALTTLCQGHNGYLLITGAISTAQSMRLSKYFVQILAGVTNAQVAVDPRGVLDKNSEHRIAFSITEADYGMDLILLSPYPGIIDFQLESPDGTRITPLASQGGANARFVLSRYAAYYRCALPVLPGNASGSREGLWHAVLKLGHGSSVNDVDLRQKESFTYYDDARGFVLPYDFVAHTYSSLTFKAHLTQSGFGVGAQVTLAVALHEYDAPLTSSAKVWAEIQRPDNVIDVLVLAADAGQAFALDYTLKMPGVFSVRLRARGETTLGLPFERERTLTAVAVAGQEMWDPGAGQSSGLCQLLHCFEENGVFSEKFIVKMEKAGIDIEALLKCLRKRCESTANALEAAQPKGKIEGLIKELKNVSCERLVEALVELVRATEL